MQDKIRLLMVDDNDLARQGTAALLALESWLEIVGTASNGMEALVLAAETQPDIVLMDINMPVMDGLEATRQLTQRYSHIKVIALTQYDDEHYIRQVMSTGAKGYALKSTDYQKLLITIDSVQKGLFVFPPLSSGLELLNPLEVTELPLTPRQTEVAVLWADGHSACEIARKLAIGTRGVESHIQNIYRATRAKNRIELRKILERYKTI